MEKLENAEKVVEIVGNGSTTDYPTKLSHQSEARLSFRLVVGLDGMPYIKEKSETDKTNYLPSSRTILLNLILKREDWYFGLNSAATVS